MLLGEEKEFEFHNTYEDAGYIESLAIVDPENRISEAAELENSYKITLATKEVRKMEIKTGYKIEQIRLDTAH